MNARSNAVPTNATREGVVKAHTLYGQPASGTFVAEQDGVIPAGMLSTAPWKNPREGKCAGNDNTCQGTATKTSPYCSGHQRSLLRKGVPVDGLGFDPLVHPSAD